MIQQVPRTRLEQRVQGVHMSVREFVDRFHTASVECGEDAHISERQAKRWLAGVADLPRPVCRRVLEHWWDEPVTRLLGPPDSGPVAVVLTEEELIVNAGRESIEHAIRAAAALDPSVLEHLHSAVRYAASAFYQTPPLVMLTDLVRLRDTIYDQLDRTYRLRQQAELYLLAGQVCGLLSAACTNLGHLQVAEEQARAAHTYGNVIDHPVLCAWAREKQVHLLDLTGRSRRATDLAAAALDAAPTGLLRASLYGTQARSLAAIGARQEVRAALDAANEESQRATDDPFLDVIGAELIYPPTRHTILAASSFIALGDGEQAEAEANTALGLFSEVPETDRWISGELCARVDLARAHVIRGDLAGAEDALGPVFAVRAELRTEGVIRRLTDLGRRVGMARYRDAVEANRIGQAIEDFTADRVLGSITRAVIS